MTSLGDGYVATWRDVTEVRATADRYARAIELWPDPFVILLPVRDAGGGIVDFVFEELNPAAVAELASVGGARGSRMHAILPGNFEDGTFEALIALVAGGPPTAVEREVVRADGTRRLIDARRIALPDGRIASTWRDVTEVRAMEAALRRAAQERRLALQASELRYRDLIEGVDGVFWSVREGDRPEVEYVSPAAEALFGYPLARWWEPGFWSTVVAPEDIARRLAVRHDGELEYAVRTADGRTVWILERIRTVLADDARPPRRIGVIFDITERRLLRERLHRRARVEAVGRLAAAAAHDFDNVLLGIGVHARLLAAAERDPGRSTDLVRILDAVEHGNALVRQLLDVGRSSDPPVAAADLVEIVRRAEPLLARLAGPAVELRLRAGDAPVPVVIAPSAVEQVLCNLVINARDAMPGGGRCTIEVGVRPAGGPAPAASPSAGAGAGIALVAVHDTGIGMSPEVAARAFEPFYTTKTEDEGTGLGLASVRHLVTAAGGTVDLHTAPGAGTTVELLLPLGSAEPRPADGREPGPAPRPGQSV